MSFACLFTCGVLFSTGSPQDSRQGSAYPLRFPGDGLCPSPCRPPRLGLCLPHAPGQVPVPSEHCQALQGDNKVESPEIADCLSCRPPSQQKSKCSFINSLPRSPHDLQGRYEPIAAFPSRSGLITRESVWSAPTSVSLPIWKMGRLWDFNEINGGKACHACHKVKT